VIYPAPLLAHLAQEIVAGLSLKEQIVLACTPDIWLRPEQQISRSDWIYYGFICGRGYGKTLAVGHEINRRVEAGESRSIGLMAPTLPRVGEVQIQTLIDTAPPWFKPIKVGDAGCVWPNGARALGFSPEAPGRCRSENFDLSWATELVDWQPTTRKDAWNNFSTATRASRDARLIWDTTNKGQNELILMLLDLHDNDPKMYPIQRGAMFDNPMLTRKYLHSECRKYVPGTRAYNEEVLGLVYAEAPGALWAVEWIETHRRLEKPRAPELRLISIDPGLTGEKTSDKVGFVIGSRTSGHVYVEEDLSDHMTPDMYGDLAVRKCIDQRCAGVIIERNHVGDHAAFVITSAARNHQMQVRLLDKRDPFPAWTPGVIYVREVVAASSKITRAEAPASETKAGRVHVVGNLSELERQWTTFEPGSRKSPNQYDASVYLILELAQLGTEETNAAADLEVAAAAHKVLHERLSARARRI
jgi:phage terminase large subunit-like protein